MRRRYDQLRMGRPPRWPVRASWPSANSPARAPSEDRAPEDLHNSARRPSSLGRGALSTPHMHDSPRLAEWRSRDALCMPAVRARPPARGAARTLVALLAPSWRRSRARGAAPTPTSSAQSGASSLSRTGHGATHRYRSGA
jgi:hypothetical protein